MRIKLDKSVIGQEGYVLSKSIVSDCVDVIAGKITGVMIDKNGCVSVRFDSGKWFEEKHVLTAEELEKRKTGFSKTEKNN